MSIGMFKPSLPEIIQPNTILTEKHTRDGKKHISMKTILLVNVHNSKSICKRYLSRELIRFQIKDWIHQMKEIM